MGLADMLTRVCKLARDQNGAVLVESTIMLTISFVFILGSIDFLMLVFQWNAAAKAAALGARIAAVSDPVASGLNALSTVVVSADLPAGSAMPFFAVTCVGSSRSCRCEGVCTGVIAYDSTSMNSIVFGRGSSSCTDASSAYGAGMCDIVPTITPANIVISYIQTGRGFAGRPGGPVPTVTVSIINLPFRFFFIGGLFRNNRAIMPPVSASTMAEDLASVAP